jgi:hypothetical protein
MVTKEGDIFKAFLGICIFIITLTTVFLRIFLKQQKKYQSLELEKLHAELKASQSERDDIATELHNDILPNLSTIHYWLHQINTRENVMILQSINLLNETIDKSRNIIKSISPVSQFGLSFQSAIVDYIQSLKGKNELVINFIELDEIELGREHNNLIFRILQEIILNTLKHANAKRLDIEISKSNEFLLIRTADDGIGFQLSSNFRTGYGLLSIESKVEFLNGVININELSKSGAQFNIKIPIS